MIKLISRTSRQTSKVALERFSTSSTLSTCFGTIKNDSRVTVPSHIVPNNHTRVLIDKPLLYYTVFKQRNVLDSLREIQYQRFVQWILRLSYFSTY